MYDLLFCTTKRSPEKCEIDNIAPYTIVHSLSPSHLFLHSYTYIEISIKLDYSSATSLTAISVSRGVAQLRIRSRTPPGDHSLGPTGTASILLRVYVHGNK